jgi:predicted phage terminase large subunit-like protein
MPRKQPERSDAPPSPQLTLKQFVELAWHTLEPVSELQWNWHLDLICEYLTLIKDNEFKNVCGPHLEGIIFNVPPRTMKSLLITVFFPIWLWTSDPARRFMFVSYSEKLSTQHSVFRRMVIESDFYQERWGKLFSFSKDQNLKSHYENSSRGAMFSTGMQATATGLGGDVLIFDDPLNPEQAVSQLEREAVNLRFDTTFRSRVNNPATAVKIIIMQRLHELDLTGHILSREAQRWKHIALPALGEQQESFYAPDGRPMGVLKPGQPLWPARLPQSFLDSQRIGMGSWAFNGQYQQSPAPLEGGLIKRSWVRFYRQLPEAFDFTVQSWDCTFSGGSDNDFVAGQVWARANGKFYMLPYRTYERLDFGPTKAAIKACHAKFPRAHAILIEDKANGPAIISELQKEIPGVIGVNPEGGKIARAQATAPLWEAGSIELPDPQVFGCPWIEDYIHNICTFPKAAHDDDVDATSQALIYMRTRLGGGIIDFYRRQASGEAADPVPNAATLPSTATLPSAAMLPNVATAQPSPPNKAESPSSSDKAGAPAFAPELTLPQTSRFARQRTLREHSSSAGSPLVRNIMEALEQGSQIVCGPGQYPPVRIILVRLATDTSPELTTIASHAQRELDRLDRMHCRYIV